ncbi:MAG: hypothetical protein E7090_06140 [Bacteroidales bacterium]|nr:hypothetical protein [Bacteroidales bacterium]
MKVLAELIIINARSAFRNLENFYKRLSHCLPLEENEQQHTSQMIARGPALNAIKVTTLML